MCLALSWSWFFRATTSAPEGDTLRVSIVLMTFLAFSRYFWYRSSITLVSSAFFSSCSVSSPCLSQDSASRPAMASRLDSRSRS
uniref:Putative secreted protein n=1 Tax=Ixodes ricinus TaxID=34613 RepID=A0A6B0U6S5_IXORI